MMLLEYGSEKDWCSAGSGQKPTSVNRVLMDCSHARSFAYPSVLSFTVLLKWALVKSQRGRNLTFYRHFLNPLYEQGDSDSTQLAAAKWGLRIVIIRDISVWFLGTDVVLFLVARRKRSLFVPNRGHQLPLKDLHPLIPKLFAWGCFWQRARVFPCPSYTSPGFEGACLQSNRPAVPWGSRETSGSSSF